MLIFVIEYIQTKMNRPPPPFETQTSA